MSEFFDAGQTVELTVELAFGSNPLSTTPTWTDVTSYVRTLDWKRGKSDAIGQYQPGSASIVFSNSDGRFDPTYASGAYNPNVKALVPFRISATYSATTYVLFRGFAESWSQSYRSKVDPVVSFDARDGFSILSLLNTTTQEDQETTSVRIGNLLDYALWPSAWRTFDAGTVSVIFLQTECKTVTAAIRQIEDAEGGWFFFDRNGNAVFRNRNDRSAPTPSFVFGEGVTDVPYQSVEIRTDSSMIRNQISVSRIGGTTQTVNNAGSQTQHGIRGLRQLDIPLTTDAAALALANLLLTRYSSQTNRIGPLSLTPLSAPTLAFPAVLSLDLGDCVDVKRDPGYGTGISERCFVEGLSHKLRWRDRSWVVTYNLSQVA